MSLDLSASTALEVMANAGDDPIDLCSPEIAQRNYLDGYADYQLPLEPVGFSGEIRIDGIRTRIWRGIDTPTENARAMLYIHGGGWVIGSPETHEDVCRSIANRARAVLVSPEYALAPKAPFPAGLNDCISILQHLAANASSYGIEPTQIVLGGDSAGGNLAAVLSLLSRDGYAPPIKAQMLLNPVTDCRQETESFVQKATGFGLTATAMAWFRDHYLQKLEEKLNWRASPLLAPSLKGVAPAFVALAGQDVLHDEGKAYADRLESESVCIVNSWPGQIHGFTSLRRFIPEGDDAINEMVAAWERLAP